MGSRAAWIATAGQPNGTDHCPIVPASVAAASASKLTTTLTFLDIVVTQDPRLLQPPSADFSHWPPAHALMPRPPVAVAVGLTELPRGNPAVQLPATASGYVQQTLVAQLAAAVFDHFPPGFYVVVVVTALILVLAANTAFKARALKKAGLSGVHVHDLRHTGNHFAATSGASTRELMGRMGHVSVNAAMVYQHRTAPRDRAIADSLDAMVHELAWGNPLNSGHVEGTALGIGAIFDFGPGHGTCM